MELTQWKLPNGTYAMDVANSHINRGIICRLIGLLYVTSLNLHNGSFLIELTQWKLPKGT